MIRTPIHRLHAVGCRMHRRHPWCAVGMRRSDSALILLLPVLLAGAGSARAQPYPASRVITAVTFDVASHDARAPGSDNWPMTWADDDDQYTSWGDGGGFGGTNQNGRVSLGVARIEGLADSYQGFNVWGGVNPEAQATFGGKSYGILSLDGVLYMWVAPGSGAQNYSSQTPCMSQDHGHSWTCADWSFTQDQRVVLPTFLQFGRDYQAARDQFVYVYAIFLEDPSALKIQKPGRIDLFRVDRNRIMERDAYEFFSGLDGSGNPRWTADLSARRPVFEDADGVGWTLSVAYDPGLARYLLCTEHGTSFQGNLGIFDAPEPWGPWTTVGYFSNWEGFSTTFFWNFAPKWFTQDGTGFVTIFAGTGTYDSWNSVPGRFSVAPLASPSSLEARAVSESRIDLSWTDASEGETGFVLQRFVLDWEDLAEVGSGVTTFSDEGLEASTTYRYRVRALAGARFSDWSNEASATTFDGATTSDGGAEEEFLLGGELWELDGTSGREDAWTRDDGSMFDRTRSSGGCDCSMTPVGATSMDQGMPLGFLLLVAWLVASLPGRRRRRW